MNLIRKLRELWASRFIPKRSIYCHHHFEQDADGNWGAKSCKYWCMKYNKELEFDEEYCKYLHKFLDIQDQVKDCGINED